MLYDLNIPWSPSTPPDTLLHTLATASSLGYTTVALNHTLEHQPGAHSSPPAVTFPVLPPPPSSSRKLPTVLRRATFPLADPSAPSYRLPALAAAYDLLAVRPTTAEAFQNACLTLDVPLVSLDLARHHRFPFRPRPCMAAVARGVRFEVCYAQLLAAGQDPRARAAFVGNLRNLLRATRGRGLVVSSEAAAGALALRGPADVVNLLAVWGLPPDRGLEALRALPRGLVVNEGVKRNGFRGVVDVVQIAEEPAAAAEDAPAVSLAHAPAENGKKQKRKTAQQEDGSQMSKRQAKKMRLANRAAAAAATEPSG